MPTPLRRLLRITPQQLRAFETTARLLSVTRAAEAMHLSQPTVSVQLKELAGAIGEPLFEYSGRKLRLTQTGETLQQTVAKLIDCWQHFEANLNEQRGLVRGHLRIAAVTTAEYFVPDLIGPFAAAHPGVEFELCIENRDRVVQRLQQRSDDLVVMMLPPQDLPLRSLPFLDNPLIVLAGSGHPLAGKGLKLGDLAEERWLMREPGSGTRRVAEQHFAEAEFKPKIAMSLGSNEAIKHSVAAGLGIAVISRLAVSQSGQSDLAAAGLTELQVRGFPIERRWSLVWRSDHPLSATAKRFVSYLQATPQSKPQVT